MVRVVGTTKNCRVTVNEKKSLSYKTINLEIWKKLLETYIWGTVQKWKRIEVRDVVLQAHDEDVDR